MSGLSAGSVAGAIVGTAVGTALLAVILTAYVYRRPGQTASQVDVWASGDRAPEHLTQPAHVEPKPSGPSPQAASHDRQLATTTMPAEVPVYYQALYTRFGHLDLHLPLPDAGVILNLARSVLFTIEGICDCQYDSKAKDPTPDPATTQLLAELDIKFLPLPLATMMYRKPLRTRLLMQHCIAYLLLARISLDAPPNDSLLPPLLQEVPDAVKDEDMLGDADNVLRPYGVWRRLNGLLFRPRFKNDTAYKQRRDRVAVEFAETVRAAFAPWELENQDTRRTLISLAIEASELGIAIQSHPGTFRWDWQLPDSTMVPSFVSRPGLSQIRDEDTMKLKKPLVRREQVITDYLNKNE